ncbi:hypothetical protein EVAR_96386_1 [Eumeta japonica]|uniref:Uncharacterized protein n=1 Tax=Eumeta variegata TaxID=151549 RepID=A0A4C1WAD3_EUMVA|nr:hypothetical protein EVAR_96386_1 [Eumeta japonica]
MPTFSAQLISTYEYRCIVQTSGADHLRSAFVQKNIEAGRPLPTSMTLEDEDAKSKVSAHLRRALQVALSAEEPASGAGRLGDSEQATFAACFVEYKHNTHIVGGTPNVERYSVNEVDE